jgi:4-hydroxybenzoyl-CoA reductase subunit beta
VRLPEFEIVEAKSLGEASSVLVDEPTAKILAGGTDLLVNMKHRVERPSVLVSIKRIDGLDRLEEENGTIRIGALVSLKKIYKNPHVESNFPALSKAASSVGGYHHQSMGTLGGNICQQTRCRYFNQSLWWRSSRPPCFKAGGETCYVMNKKKTCYASYCGDLAPALLALNAKIRLESNGATREIPLESLFSGNGKVPLTVQRGEIVTAFIVPQDAQDGFSTYVKFANRQSIDFPIVGLALWASRTRREVRVSYTAVDRRPVRACRAEGFLNGKDLQEKRVEEAVDLATKEAGPVKTSIYAPRFKRKIMGVLLETALKQALRSQVK